MSSAPTQQCSLGDGSVLPAVQMWPMEQQGGYEPSWILADSWASSCQLCSNIPPTPPTVSAFVLFPSKQHYEKNYFKQEKSKLKLTTKTIVKWGIVPTSDSHSALFHAGSEELGFHQCSTRQHGTENIFSANESSLSQQVPGAEHWGTKTRRRKLEGSKNLYHSLWNRFTTEELSIYITHQQVFEKQELC